jgi:hypothetical protein
MDAHSVNPSQRNIHPTISLAVTSDSSSSELGRMGKDVGGVLNKYQEKIHGALLQWQEDADELEGILSRANTDIGEIHAMMTAYKNWPDGVYITPSGNQRMLDMMNDLGVPPSQIQGGAMSGGDYYYTGSQYLADIKLAVGHLSTVQSNIAKCKQDETKDMFSVMAFYNSEKMNQQSLSGLLQTITSISQALMQNIQ